MNQERPMARMHGTAARKRLLAPALFRAAALCCLLFGLISCAGAPLNVSHMRRDAWSLDEARSLSMNFLRFDYQVMAVGQSAGVKGWAYVDPKKIPAGSAWVDSVRITAYLCDQNGDVLAQDTKTFLPRPVRAEEGIAFEFTLSPEDWGSTPPQVTFGYRLVITGGRDVQNDNPPFFANEDAISR